MISIQIRRVNRYLIVYRLRDIGFKRSVQGTGLDAFLNTFRDRANMRAAPLGSSITIHDEFIRIADLDADDSQ